jgi:hypothetical protein
VHLPVLAQVLAVGVEHGGGVVVYALGPFFKQEATITTFSSFARAPNDSVDGPGIDSANLKLS